MAVDPNSPLGIVLYYANLLIIQYLGKPKAYAEISTLVAPVIMPQTTVQVLSFSDISASGAFVMSYNGVTTASIAWNASLSTIQSDLQAVTGLSLVTVTGSISSQSLIVTFTGVAPPAQLLVVSSNTLLNASSLGISITLSEIDQTLPLAVQNGFNMIGSNPAVGVQLDVLGKYVGVSRTSGSNMGTITLDDADFLTLIKFAAIQNNSGSSLSTLETNFNIFFPGQFIITDYKNMYLSYLFNTALGSSNLFQALINENLIPAPMGVGTSVAVVPAVNVFYGFWTYDFQVLSNKPFNTYDNFNKNWFYFSYSYVII